MFNIKKINLFNVIDMSSPMIFIDNFTLYYIADVAEQNPKVVPISLPEQVIPEVLINGIPDWTYEGIYTFFPGKQ